MAMNRRGFGIALLGSLLGGAAATTSSAFFESLLFGVEPADLPTLTGGAGLALVCVVLACVPPALRAATTDPADVLRSE